MPTPRSVYPLKRLAGMRIQRQAGKPHGPVMKGTSPWGKVRGSGQLLAVRSLVGSLVRALVGALVAALGLGVAATLALAGVLALAPVVARFAAALALAVVLAFAVVLALVLVLGAVGEGSAGLGVKVLGLPGGHLLSAGGGGHRRGGGAGGRADKETAHGGGGEHQLRVLGHGFFLFTYRVL